MASSRRQDPRMKPLARLAPIRMVSDRKGLEMQEIRRGGGPRRPPAGCGMSCLFLAGVLPWLAAGGAGAQSPSPDSFSPNASSNVFCIATQPDGKILIGGAFKDLSGHPARHLARLNPDGSPDLSLDADADGSVFAIAIQSDGGILVGGFFTRIGGKSRGHLARFMPDGTLDANFDPGADGAVLSLTVQPNGKILVGGAFQTLGGTERYRIARLHPSGAVDREFAPGSSHPILSMVLQPNGRILAGGFFKSIGGVDRSFVARLWPDGSVDDTFAPEPDGPVSMIAVQPDGRILLAGYFSRLGGVARGSIARVEEDGSLDTDFDPKGGVSITAIALRADGRMVIGGDFGTMESQRVSRIALLNADGTLDAGFNPGADQMIYALALQADGRILVGGRFAKIGGQPRNHIARLSAVAPPASDDFRSEGSRLVWLRGGTSPEVGRTYFEHSRDGIAWSPLGQGTRIPGGWELDLPSTITTETIRARGDSLGSKGIFEAAIGAPRVVGRPWCRTNDAATMASVGVHAIGSKPLTFRWRKDGVPMKDLEKVRGTGDAVLSIDSLHRSDSGGYDVIVSNSFGSTTSTVATLEFRNPAPSVEPEPPGKVRP